MRRALRPWPEAEAGGDDAPVETRRLDVLGREECRARLAPGGVGRLGIVRGGYPVIFPVNYAMHGDRVVIRTDDGPKLRAARFRRVSFEVGALDHERRTGWSVLIQGFGTEVDPGDPSYDALAAPVTPWAPGKRDRLLVITPVTVTGRAIVSTEVPGPTGR